MRRCKPIRAAVCSIALLAAPSLLQAQSDRDRWLENCRRSPSSQGVRYCEIRDVAVQTTGRIDVDPGRNGGATITGWDGNQVSAEARIQAEGRTMEEARARARALNIRSSNGTLRVGDPGGQGSASAILVIQAPRRTNVTARAHNGPLAISAIEGAIRAEVVNGPLALRDLAGDVRAHTVNGPLAVSLGGLTWVGRGIEATAENGPVALAIPQGYSAALSAGTVNGPLVVDFPNIVREPSRRRNMIETRIGNGGPPVRVTSVNGPAVIRIREDQRTTSM